MARHISDSGEVVLPRRHRGRWIAAALVIILIVAVGVYVWGRNLSSTSGSTTVRCVGEVSELVVATPELNVPVIEKAAEIFAEQDVTGCRKVKVVAQEDSLTLAQLSEGKKPNVWIANGHSWMAAARIGGVRIMSQAEVASSPVVLAMPTDAADAHRWSRTGMVGGDQLLSMINVKRSWQRENFPNWGPFQLRIMSASPEGAGTDAFAAVTEGVAGDAAADLEVAAKDPWALATLRKAMTDDPGADAKLPYSEATSTDEAMAIASATATTEQSVVAYTRGAHTVPVSAIALSSPSRSVVTIAAALEDVADIKASAFVNVLTEISDESWSDAGLRSASGSPSEVLAGDGGVGIKVATSLDTSSSEVLGQAAKTWRWMQTQGATLAVMDWSGSMKTSFPGTNSSRLDVVVNSAFATGIPYSRDGDKFGVTLFHTNKGKAMIRPIVPIGRSGTGPNGEPGAIQLAVLGQASQPVGGDTPLYQAIISGMQQITANYSDGMINNLLVVTDGRNDIDGGPSRADVIAQINAMRDPNRPVTILLVGVGSDADMDDLRAIASDTDSIVLQVSDAADIDKITAYSLFYMR